MRIQCFERKRTARKKCDAAREAKAKLAESWALRRRVGAAATIQAAVRARKARSWFVANRADMAARLARRRAAAAASADLAQRVVPGHRDHGPRGEGEGYADDDDDGGGGGGGGGGGDGGGGGGEVVADWFEKMWDDSAEAWYWYNQATGEAVWTDPNAA